MAARQPRKPTWNAELRELRWGKQLVKNSAHRQPIGLEYLLPGRQEGDFKFQIPSEEPEAVTTFEYTWVNPESEPVQLTFFQSSCGCMKAQSLPVWVAPAETAKVTIAFTARSKPGDFVQKFAILTSKTTLRGVVYGRIREPAGE